MKICTKAIAHLLRKSAVYAVLIIILTPPYASAQTVANEKPALPVEDRKLRVLLGDPPVDWSKITRSDDIPAAGGLRDIFPADLIQREVLAKRRHALVVYGNFHFLRKIPEAELQQMKTDGHLKAPVTIVQRLESAGTRVLSINTEGDDLTKVQPDIATWPM